MKFLAVTLSKVLIVQWACLGDYRGNQLLYELSSGGYLPKSRYSRNRFEKRGPEFFRHSYVPISFNIPNTNSFIMTAADNTSVIELNA